MVINLKYNISNEKLKLIVDELGEEYKDMLIAKTLSNLDELDIDEISPSELIRLDVEIKKRLNIDKAESKRNRILSLISLVGVLYAMLGLFLMIFKELDRYMIENPANMIAILCIFIGLLTSIMAIFMKLYPIKTFTKNSTPMFSQYEIVSKWKEIEAIMIQLTPVENQSTLKKMIDYLEDLNIINNEDYQNIKQLLSYRNSLVHSTNEKDLIPNKQSKELIKKADDIIKKLKLLI